MRKFAVFSALILSLSACDSESDSDGTTDTGPGSQDTGQDTAQTGDSGQDSTESPDDGVPAECWSDLAIGSFEVFFDGFEENSEGISFGADGHLYVTSDDALWRLDAQGNRSRFAEVPKALGLAPTDDGFVVASIGESVTVGVADGGVYHVSSTGEVSLIVDGMDSPNFITMTPEGHALVSDDFDTRVWLVTRAGEVSVAIENIESPNGMAYLPNGSALVVASTFSPQGEITSFPVDDKGLPTGAERTVLSRLGALATADGVAVASNGDIYVAANLRGQIVRVPAGGGDHEIVATGLGSPASLAFGAGDGFDPCSIYVTQLFGSQVLRVSAGIGGAPLIPGRFGTPGSN